MEKPLSPYEQRLTETERRWGSYIAGAFWCLSALLVAVLVLWSVEPYLAA